MIDWQDIAINGQTEGLRNLAKAMLNQAPAPERKEDPVVARIREMSKSFILPPIDPKIEAEIEAEKLKAAQDEQAETDYLKNTQAKLSASPVLVDVRTNIPRNEPAQSQRPSLPKSEFKPFDPDVDDGIPF